MYYRVKKTKTYPWPCEANKERVIMIYIDDVLQSDGNDIYTKLTGVCCCNIHIPKEDIRELGENIKLRMI